MAAKKLTQKDFDVQKWLDSEAKGTDTCGTYDFCSYCDKNGDTPCEVASKACEAAKKAAKAAAKATTAEKKPAAKKATTAKKATATKKTTTAKKATK